MAALGVAMAFAAPARAGDTELLRQAGQADGTVVIRDESGWRAGTMERSGWDWTVRDKTGRRVGAILWR